MPGLLASSTRNQGITVITLTGELDLSTTEGLSAQMAKAFRKGPDLVLDLTGLVFIDSTGIGLLVQAYLKSTEGGGTMALAGCRPQVARALQLSGVDHRMPCHTTASQALAAHALTLDTPS